MWRKSGARAVLLGVGILLAGIMWLRPWSEVQSGAVTNESVIPTEQGQAAPKDAATYTADMQIDPKAHRVTGTLTVRFVPKDDHVYFHLYPNTFQKAADLSTDSWERVLGKQREPGGIQITSVRVNGEDVPVRYQGPTQTLLHVPIASSGMGTAAHSEIEMRFQLQVPYNKGRLSYNDNAMWLGNWLPILAVKESGGWRLDPYSAIGDPFYSETANYHLRVQLADEYQLATSGVESVAVVTQTRPQRQTLYEIDALNVRDLAMVVMDDTYHKVTATVEDTVVHIWSQEGDDPRIVSRLHEAAEGALRYFSEQFGPYPYKEYDVVKTGGFFGGMEYPGIVFIQEEFFERADPIGDAVIAHETAHQWFYGLVGNDEVREAWLDESLSDYATLAYLTDVSRNSANLYIKMRRAQSREAEAYAAKGLAVWQSVEQFPDWDSYVRLVYARGGAMLWHLSQEWGQERVHRILRQFVSQHQYGQAKGQQLVELLSKEAGADATPFIDYWLHLKLDQQEHAKAWVEKGKHE